MNERNLTGIISTDPLEVIPRYLQIAYTLISKAEQHVSGRYLKLPSVYFLSESLQVAYRTVKKAFTHLAKMGNSFSALPPDCKPAIFKVSELKRRYNKNLFLFY
jgi:DNA-binding transcriptional MocR family regulator